MKLFLFANSNNSLKSWIRLELQGQLYDADVQRKSLPGQGVPSFCSSTSPAVAQEISECPQEDKHLHVQVSSGPAHEQQTCHPVQFSSLCFFLVLPSALVA